MRKADLRRGAIVQPAQGEGLGTVVDWHTARTGEVWILVLWQRGAASYYVHHRLRELRKVAQGRAKW